MTFIKVCTFYYSVIVRLKYLDTADVSTQMLSIVIDDTNFTLINTNYSIKLKQKKIKNIYFTL